MAKKKKTTNPYIIGSGQDVVTGLNRLNSYDNLTQQSTQAQASPYRYRGALSDVYTDELGDEYIGKPISDDITDEELDGGKPALAKLGQWTGDTAKWGGDMMRTLGKKITELIFNLNAKDYDDLNQEKDALNAISTYKKAVADETLHKSNLLKTLKKYGYIDGSEQYSNEDLLKLLNAIQQDGRFVMGVVPPDLSEVIDNFKNTEYTISSLDDYFKGEGRHNPVVQELMFHNNVGFLDGFRIGAESATEGIDRNVPILQRLNDDHILNTLGGIIQAPFSAIGNTISGQTKNVALDKLDDGDSLIEKLYSGRDAFDDDTNSKLDKYYEKNKRLSNAARIKTQADIEFYTTGIFHPSLVAKTLGGNLDLFNIFDKYTELDDSDLGKSVGKGSSRKNIYDTTGDYNSFKFFDPETISKEYEKAQREGSGKVWRPDLWLPEIGSTLGLVSGIVGSAGANSVANWALKHLPVLVSPNKHMEAFAALKSAIIAADVSAGISFAKLSRIGETAGEALSGQAERVVNTLSQNGVGFNETMNEIKNQLQQCGYAKDQLDILTPDKLISLAISYNIRTDDPFFNAAVKDSRKGLSELINANNSLAYMDYLGCYLPFTSYGGSMFKSFANNMATTGERLAASGPIKLLTGTTEREAQAIANKTYLGKLGDRLYNPTSVTQFTPTIGGVLDDIAVPVVQKFKPTVNAVFDHLATRAATAFAEKQLPKLALWTKHIADYAGYLGQATVGTGLVEGLEEGNQEILQLRYKKGEFDDIHEPYTIFSIPNMLDDVSLSLLTIQTLFGLDNEFTAQERDQIKHATAVGFLVSTVLPFAGTVASSFNGSYENPNWRNLFRQLRSDTQAAKAISKDQQAALNMLLADNQIVRQLNAQEQQDIQDYQHAGIFFDALHKLGVSREKMQQSLIDYMGILDTVKKTSGNNDNLLISKQFVKQDIDLLNAVATLYDSPFIKEIVKDNNWTMYGEEHKQAVIDGATQIVGAAIHNKVAELNLFTYKNHLENQGNLITEYFNPATSEQRRQEILDRSPFMSSFIRHAIGLFDKTLAADASYRQFATNPQVIQYAKSILQSRLSRPETSINPARQDEKNVKDQEWTLEDIIKEEFEKHKANPGEYKSKLGPNNKYVEKWIQDQLTGLVEYREMLQILKTLDLVSDLEKWQSELNSLTGLDTNVKNLQGAKKYLKQLLDLYKKNEQKRFSLINKDKQAGEPLVNFESWFNGTAEFDNAADIEKSLFGYLLNASANRSLATVRNAYLNGVTLYGKAITTPSISDLNLSLYGDDENSPLKSISDAAEAKLREIENKDELERTIGDIEELAHIDEKGAKAMISARLKEREKRNKIAHQIYEQERSVNSEDISRAEDGDLNSAERVFSTVSENQNEAVSEHSGSLFGNGSLFSNQRESSTETEARHNEDGTTSVDDALNAAILSARNQSQKSEEAAAEEHREELRENETPATVEPEPAPAIESRSGSLASIAADVAEIDVVEGESESAPVVEIENTDHEEGENTPTTDEVEESHSVQPVVEEPVVDQTSSSNEDLRNLISMPDEIADVDIDLLINQAQNDRRSRTPEQNERRKTRKLNADKFGDKNKIVTKSQKDTAVDFIKKYLSGNTNGLTYLDHRNTYALPLPVSPDLIAALGDLALFVIEAGSRKFGDFVHEMYDQLRDNGVSHENIVAMQGNPEINFKQLYTSASTRYVNGNPNQQADRWNLIDSFLTTSQSPISGIVPTQPLTDEDVLGDDALRSENERLKSYIDLRKQKEDLKKLNILDAFKLAFKDLKNLVNTSSDTDKLDNAVFMLEHAIQVLTDSGIDFPGQWKNNADGVIGAAKIKSRKLKEALAAEKLAEDEELQKQEDERRRKEQESENQANADLAMSDALAQMDMDEETGQMMIEGQVLEQNQQNLILAEMEFLIMATYQDVSQLIDQANRKGDTDSRFASTRRQIANFINRTFFYDPKATTPMSLSIDGKAVTLNKPLGVGSELAKKLLNPNWLKNANKYYLVSRREAVAKDDLARNNPDCFNVVMIIEDDMNSYAVALRQLGSYMEVDPVKGVSYITNNERIQRQNLEKVGTVYENESPEVAAGRLYEQELLIAEDFYEAQGNRRPVMKVDATTGLETKESKSEQVAWRKKAHEWYEHEPSLKDAKEKWRQTRSLIKDLARAKAARKNSTVLTNEQIDNYILALKDNRNQIIDAVLTKDGNGNYVFPDPSKPYPQKARPKSYNLSNGRFDNMINEDGSHEFRPVHNGNVSEIQMSLDDGSLVIGLGLGFFSKTNPGEYVIRTMGDSAREIDGKGYSGKLYVLVDTPMGGSAVIMLSEELFDIQQRQDGSQLQANTGVKLVFDESGNVKEDRYRASAAESILHMMCGVISNRDLIFGGNVALAQQFATFFMNNGEATIIDKYRSKSKMFKSTIAAFAEKQIYWNDEEQALYIALPTTQNGSVVYEVQRFTKAQIFANTPESIQNKLKIVQAIASQMHWNTEEDHMSAKLSDGAFADMMNALKRYFVQTGEQSVSIMGCPQLTFNKQDLFDDEMNVIKNATVLSWMIKTMRIKTDISELIFRDPFVFADGVEQSASEEVIIEAQKSNQAHSEESIEQKLDEVSVVNAQADKLNSIRQMKGLVNLEITEESERQAILDNFSSMGFANGRKVKDVFVMDISKIQGTGAQVWDAIKNKITEKYGKDKVQFSEEALKINMLAINSRSARRGDTRTMVPQIILFEDGTVHVSLQNVKNVINSGVTGVFSKEKRGKLDEKKARTWLKKVLGIEDANIIVSNAILKSMDGEEVYGLTCLSLDTIHDTLSGDIHLSRNFGGDLQYHEAWHYVNLLLHNSQQREAIYREYVKIHPELKDAKLKDIEEAIADEFMAYMTVRDSWSPIKIVKRLYDNVKTLLKIGLNKGAYRAVFNAIRKGQYASMKMDLNSVKEFQKRFPMGIAYDGYIQNIDETILRKMKNIKTYHDFYNTAEAVINKLLIDLNIKTIRDIRRICGVDFVKLLDSVKALAEQQTDPTARGMIMDFVENPQAFQKALISYLSKYGIKAKIKSFKKDKQDEFLTDKTISVDDQEIIDDKPEEERGLQYDKFDLAESKKSNASIETKLFMSRVPVLEPFIQEDGSIDYIPAIDMFNIPKYFSFNEVWTSLLEVLHNCDSFDKKDARGNYLPNSVMGLCETQARSSVMFKAVLSMFNEVIQNEDQGFYIQLKQMLQTTFNSSKPRIQMVLISDPQEILSYNQLDALVSAISDIGFEDGEAAYRTVSDKDRTWELFNDSRFDIIRSVPRRWSLNAVLNQLSAIDKHGNIVVNPVFVYGALKQLGYDVDQSTLTTGNFASGKGKLSDIKMREADNTNYENNGLLINIDILNKLTKKKNNRDLATNDQIADVVDVITDQIINLFNYLGITMDNEILNAYVMMNSKIQYKDVNDQARAEAYSQLMRKSSNKNGGNIMGIISTLVSSVSQPVLNTGVQDGKPIEELFNRFKYNTDIAKLALANNAAHPSKQEFSTRGANGDMLYPISLNNFISDVVRWLNNGEGLSNESGLSDEESSYARRLSKSSYAAHSMLLGLSKQLDENTIEDDKIKLYAFVGMKDLNAGTGADYLGITPMEDYLSKMFMLESDHMTKSDRTKQKNGEVVTKIGQIVLPIMSDKKTYYTIGSTSMRLSHDVILTKPSTEVRELVINDTYASTLEEKDASLFEKMAAYEKRDVSGRWYSLLTKDEQDSIEKEAVFRLQQIKRMNRFSDNTLDRFAGYFADELQSLIDYYSEENVKSLVKNQNQLIANFHGKVKGGRLQFGGNAGLFRYFYDIAKYTDKNGYRYNLNQRLEYLWKLQKEIEAGRLKIDDASVDDDIKNVSKIVLGKTRNLDGFELIREYLQSLKKYYFKSNRNANYAATDAVYDSINDMLISSVNTEIKDVMTNPSFEMISYVNGYLIPDKMPNQFVKNYIDDMVLEDPSTNPRDAETLHNATYSLFANNVVNNIISIIEYEKIFCGDPAMYKAKGLKSIVDHQGLEKKSRTIVSEYILPDGRTATFECEVLTIWDKFSDKIKRLGGNISPGDEVTLFYNAEEIEYDLQCERPSYLNTSKYTNLHIEDIMGVSLYLDEIRLNFTRDNVITLLRNNDENVSKLFNKYLEKRNKNSDKKISKERLINLFYSKPDVFQQFYETLSLDVKSNVDATVSQQISPYVDINVTDAQVLVRPSMYRKIRIGLGLWSFEPDPSDPSGYCDEDAYNILMNGPEWLSDEELGRLVRKLELFPLKMSYFQNDPTVAGTLNINLPIYGKQAIFPMFEFNCRTQLAKQVYKRMNQLGNEIDMISVKSAIKVGATMNGSEFIDEDEIAKFVYIQKHAYGKTAKQIRESYKKSLIKKGASEQEVASKTNKLMTDKKQQEYLATYESQLNDQLSSLVESLNNNNDNYIQYTNNEGDPLDVPTVKTRPGDNLLHTTIQDLKFLRMQLNTHAHDAEERSIGTQMFKIAFSNIIDTEQYGIGKSGQLKSGKQLRDDVMSCINALTTIGANDIKSRYYRYDGRKMSPNKSSIRKWILRVIENNGLGSSAAEIIANGGTIASLMSRTLFEQTVTKAVGDSVIKINTNGGTAIQQSSFGFGNYAPNMNTGSNVETLGDHDYGTINEGRELKWSKKDGSMEVILSANFFKSIVPSEYLKTPNQMRQWLVDNDFINGTKTDGKKSHPKAISVGYRIPTQGMSSMFVFTCADILPETYGDVIIVPKEFTAQTGSDFDVDKLYLAMMSCKNGEIITIPELDDFQWAGQIYVWKQVFDKLSDEQKTEVFGTTNWSEVSRDSELFEQQVTEYIEENHQDVISEFRKSIVGNAKTVNDLSKSQKQRYYSMQNEKAVQNQLLQDYITIISDIKNYAMARASIDTLTNMIKDNLLPYVQDKHTDYIPSFTELLPSFLTVKKMEFSTGKDGIAPFALSITNLALTQYSHLSMDYGANPYNLGALDKIEGQDGLRIADWLSAMVNAHVDVAKDPYVFAINVNKMTYNHTSFLIRAGKGLSTFTFLAQPALKRFAAKSLQRNALYGGNLDGKKQAGDRASVTKAKVMKEEMKNMFQMLQAYFPLVKDKLSKEDLVVYKNIVEHFTYKLADSSQRKNVKKVDITADTIKYVDVFNVEKGLNSIKNAQRQSNSEEDTLAAYNSVIFLLMSLYVYDDISGYADNLAELVHNSQIDTQKFGNTIMEHVNFQNSMTVFINKSDGWIITNDKEKSSKDALLLYFNQLYLMDKFKTSTEMVQEILRDWTFTANPGVIKLFKGICETLFGEETISQVDENGKATGKQLTIGYKVQKDTELIDQIASCLDNAVRHHVLFTAADQVREKNGNPLALDDKYGPIDFTLGGGYRGVALVMGKLHGLIYGNAQEHGGKNIFLRLAAFIAYIKQNPNSEAAKGLVEDGKIVNELLLQLHPQQASEKHPVGKISLMNSLMNMTIDEKLVLASAFYELLNSPIDLIRELARDLVFYSYYTDYNQNTRDGIFDIVPYQYRQQYDQAIALGLKNRKYLTALDDEATTNAGGFNAAIRLGLGTGTSVIDKYIAIISRNYWYNDKIVPRYFDTKSNASRLSSNNGTIYSNMFTPRDAESKFPGLIMSTALTTFDGRLNPPYFKIKKGNATILYQNVGSVDVPYQTKNGVSNRRWLIWMPAQKAGIHQGGMNYKEMYCDFEIPSIYETNKLPEAWARQNLLNIVQKLVNDYNNLKDTVIPINYDPRIDIMSSPQIYDLVMDNAGSLNELMYYETDDSRSLDRDNVHILPMKTNSRYITDDVVKSSKVVIEIGTTQASESTSEYMLKHKDKIIHINSIDEIDSIYDKVYDVFVKKGSAMSQADRELAGNAVPADWSIVLSEGVNIGFIGESKDQQKLNEKLSMFVQTLINSGVRIYGLYASSDGNNHSIADAVANASEYADVRSNIYVSKNLLRQTITTNELPGVLGDILMEAEVALKKAQGDLERGNFVTKKNDVYNKYQEIFSAIDQAKRQLREASMMRGNTGQTVQDDQKLAKEIEQEKQKLFGGGLSGMYADVDIDINGYDEPENAPSNDETGSEKPAENKSGLAAMSSDSFGDTDPFNGC